MIYIFDFCMQYMFVLPWADLRYAKKSFKDLFNCFSAPIPHPPIHYWSCHANLEAARKILLLFLPDLKARSKLCLMSNMRNSSSFKLRRKRKRI
jgi:hypothetical protein